MGSSVCITGGGRGIGFELARQLLDLPASRISTILVTTRSEPSTQLQELISSSNGRIVNILCKVSDDASVKDAAASIEKHLDGKGLDILVNNIGIMPLVEGGIRNMPASQLLDTFDVNVLSTHRVTSALIPLMQKSSEKKICVIGTSVGSISYAGRYTWAPTPEYKITKAALHMLTVQYGLEYGKEGFTVVVISPGYLQTDMADRNADLDVATGVAAVKDVILSAGPAENGKFLNIHVPGWDHAEGPNQYDGGEIPW